MKIARASIADVQPPRLRVSAARRSSNALNFDLNTLQFGEPRLLWLLVLPGGAARAARAAGDRAPPRRAPARGVASGPGARALSGVRRRAVLALRHRRDGAALRRARAAAGRRLDRAPRRRRHRGAARRLGLDARPRRRRQPVAAIDPVPAHARRLAELGRRSHGADVVRPHRRAAGPPHARSEHVLLLSRSPRRTARRSGSRTTRAGTRTSPSASSGGCG